MASKLKEQREPGQAKERPEEHKQHTEIWAEVGLTRLEETSLARWLIVYRNADTFERWMRFLSIQVIRSLLAKDIKPGKLLSLF
jgi:hypothetical protein